ncbi:MAG: threonyl-tRNA synthetase editing domain-containing protein, partial [Nitrosopumilaceae archaeon]
MRILQLHCDSIEYTPTKKEIKIAEDIKNPELQRLEEIVVAFIAIEDGDDSSVAQNAISQIKNSMEKIGCKKLLLYPYAHLSSNIAKPSIAMTLLSEMEDNASDLEVSHSPFGWTKSYKIQVKGHPL